MSLLRRTLHAGAEKPAQPESRLSGVRPLSHDADERPSREDRDYGQTIFTRGTVPLPRWVTGKKNRPS